MRILFLLIVLIPFLSACQDVPDAPSHIEQSASRDFPIDREDARRERRGKLTGEGGFSLFGGGKKAESDSGDGVGVNSYLWRASLDTISFMPLETVDPFGGVITTGWYENPEIKGERLKVNVIILDKKLRADAVRVSVFRQLLDKGQWRDAPPSAKTAREMEDAILTRARELKIGQKPR